MAFYSTYFTDFTGLHNAIARHPENDFIARPTGQRGDDKMPLLFPDSAALYALRVRDDGLIVGSATVYPSSYSPNASVVGQVSVRNGEKRQGHGLSILHILFNQASQDGHTLIITPFEHEGASAAPAIPQVHRQYPSVGIIYDGQSSPIHGSSRYTLQQTAFGLAPVTF